MREPALPEGMKAADRFRFESTHHQESFLRSLSERSIPYKVDENGYVVHMQRDLEQVLGLKREIYYGPTLSISVREGTTVIDDLHRELLVSEFEKSGIPYTLSNSNGTENILWSQIHGPKVDKIRQDAGFFHREISTNK